MTLEELKKYCDEYDGYHGAWPESVYEGDAVYSFILRKITSDNSQTTPCEHKFISTSRLTDGKSECLSCGKWV